jgi:adenine-specific DNA-methyltransferase
MTSSTWPTGTLHPLQRRYLAEDLVRLRRSDEQRRYAAPHRAARIDPNPHQIEAVIFALGRVRDGGCILADEVGLGKTIETGLVIAQMLAEGAVRVLLVAPKPLLGQWRQELFTLFDIEPREGSLAPGGFDGPGVFLVGREQAGSENGRDALLASGRFDLCVIDEAHEVFAGLYKRYDKFGEYKDEAKEARTAGRLRELLSTFQTPVLLLTATPIQNNLAELWGLVQYVDPLGTLLGDLPTFREVFCGLDDRQLAKGQEDELRGRLKVVVQRTLRRQAQEFLEKPFVSRQARLFEYEMSVDERALYDDVTKYLLEPGIVAFRGSQRQLLLIGFHRRMASSTRALAASLQRVADRLRRKLRGDSGEDAGDAERMLDDLEQTDIEPGTGERDDELRVTEAGASVDQAALRAELERVEEFVRRAERLVGDDGKLRALLTAFAFVTEQARKGKGAGKIVIFTESLVTQDHIRERLLESGFVRDEEVTLFRGTNDSLRAREALARWREEVPQAEGPRPSPEMAMRLALVHEFKTRSRVFISTEAGAKGLNLQFCDALVNYDLPWNPQRIEQRIGRCHRYGQKHEVTVINFLAKDNEAQQLTFDILSQKLDLFGTVLDASDKVLHHGDATAGGVLASALGAELEAELRRIYDRSRTLDEVTAELRSLRERVAEERRRFEETHARTAKLIEEHLDEDVKRVFRSLREELPSVLAGFDRDLWCAVRSYLEARAIPYELVTAASGEVLHVASCTQLPETLRDGASAAIGGDSEHTSLHLGHPLVLAAVEDARACTNGIHAAAIRVPSGASPELLATRGRRGRLRLLKLAFDGFERVERLLPVILLEGFAEPLPCALAEALMRAEVHTAAREGARASVSDEDLEDGSEELVRGAQQDVDAAEQQRFEQAAFQAQRFIEDRLLVQKRRRAELVRQLEKAQARRDAAVGSEGRAAAETRVVQLDVRIGETDAAIEKLERRDNETFQRFHDHIHERRYRAPSIERLFEMEVSIE